MEDFSGALLEEAEAEREKMPSFIPPYMFNSNGQAVSAYNGVCGFLLDMVVLLLFFK